MRLRLLQRPRPFLSQSFLSQVSSRLKPCWEQSHSHVCPPAPQQRPGHLLEDTRSGRHNSGGQRCRRRVSGTEDVTISFHMVHAGKKDHVKSEWHRNLVDLHRCRADAGGTPAGRRAGSGHTVSHGFCRANATHVKRAFSGWYC